MTPPTLNPPTDNLYKFIALMGMILMAFSSTMPIVLNEQYIEDFVIKMNQLNATQRELQKPIDLTKDPKELANDPAVQEILRQVKAEQENLRKADEDRRELLQIKLDRLGWCWWVGVAMTVAGIPLWYQLVQLPLDKTAQVDLRLKDLELVKESRAHSQSTVSPTELD